MDQRRLAFPAAAALCAALVVAAYSNFFENAFQFDDAQVVVGNLYLRSLRNLPRFFADARTQASNPMNMTYRPLVSATLAIDHALGGGLSPAAFRASQLAMMLALGALLAWFYARVMDRCLPGPWNRWVALGAATLFCVHCANTEAMNLAHARSEILSTMGVVGAFLVYGPGRERPRSWASLLPMAAGALAKIPAVVFGPLLFVFALLAPPFPPAEGAGWRARLRHAARAAAPALGAGLLLALFVEVAMRAPSASYSDGDAWHYALTQAWAWVHYLRIFALPLGLSADGDLALIADWYDTRVVVGVAVIALLGATIARSARSRERWPIAFGLAWYAIGLLPASSVLPLAEPINDHRPFLAWVGLLLAVAWAVRLGAAGLVARSPRPALATGAVAAASALLLVAHAAGAHARNRVWSTAESLWADVTQKSPGNGRAWMNLGVALMARGDYQGARAGFERALPLLPRYPTLEINLGVLDGATGDARAEQHFRRALELGPGDPAARVYFARWLAEQGRAPEALPLLEQAVALSPADEPARALLMELRLARGDEVAAAAVARDLVAVNPGHRRANAIATGAPAVVAVPADAAGYLRLGIEEGNQRRYLESALAYRAALALDPDGADALNNLGWTLGKLGFVPQAVAVLERAVARRPQMELARNNLAWVRSLAR